MSKQKPVKGINFSFFIENWKLKFSNANKFEKNAKLKNAHRLNPPVNEWRRKKWKTHAKVKCVRNCFESKWNILSMKCVRYKNRCYSIQNVYINFIIWKCIQLVGLWPGRRESRKMNKIHWNNLACKNLTHSSIHPTHAIYIPI